MSATTVMGLPTFLIERWMAVGDNGFLAQLIEAVNNADDTGASDFYMDALVRYVNLTAVSADLPAVTFTAAHDNRIRPVAKQIAYQLIAHAHGEDRLAASTHSITITAAGTAA